MLPGSLAWRPSAILLSRQHFVAANGIERWPFHTTRQTAASGLLAEGLSLKVFQEIRGHTLLSMTADTYGHLYDESFQEAADATERVFGKAV